MKYTVRTAGEVAGVYRAEGEILNLTEEQAKYLTPPLGGVLLPVEEKKAGRKDDDKAARG